MQVQMFCSLIGFLEDVLEQIQKITFMHYSISCDNNLADFSSNSHCFSFKFPHIYYEPYLCNLVDSIRPRRQYLSHKRVTILHVFMGGGDQHLFSLPVQGRDPFLREQHRPNHNVFNGIRICT